MAIVDATWIALSEDALLARSVSSAKTHRLSPRSKDLGWPACGCIPRIVDKVWAHTWSTTSVNMRDSSNYPTSVYLLLTVRTGTAVLAGKTSKSLY